MESGKEVNVLLTGTFIGSTEEKHFQQITNISPRIKLTNIIDLLAGEVDGDAAAKQKLDELLSDAEVLFGLRFPPDYLARAPKLKWFQIMSAGAERYLDEKMKKSPVTLTNASGVHATAIAEYVLQVMLMFTKQAPNCFQMKQEKKWRRFQSSMLESKTVGIVGLGSIGQEVARLSKALGMKVIATRRSAKKEGRAKNVDLLLPADRLNEMLAESDFVALTLALTSETEKYIGENEFKAMKSSAVLINISRGGVVDEEALIRALEEKTIAGAGLDVFSSEPLPADNKLWDIPNVLMSPHISGGMDDYIQRVNNLFCENLERYLAGKKLKNIVNKKLGY
ncbi:D-2-hydroxyacid dehydrogenase [Chloroflexota bacterium]